MTPSKSKQVTTSLSAGGLPAAPTPVTVTCERVGSFPACPVGLAFPTVVRTSCFDGSSSRVGFVFDRVYDFPPSLTTAIAMPVGTRSTFGASVGVEPPIST